MWYDIFITKERGNSMKCPFCSSEDNMPLASRENIYKNYQKTINQGTIRGTETGSYVYPISKCLCLKCGYVFEKMSDENLAKYHEEKKYFTN